MPETQTPQEHSPRRYALWLLILIVLLGVLSYAFDLYTPAPVPVPSLSEAIRTGEAPRPALTTETKQKVAASTGFQALVSYTDTGFEPKSPKITAGNTVRFTNNSSHELVLAVENSTYTIIPRDFAEVTFSTTGEFVFLNTAKQSDTGVVRVE